MAGGKGGSSTTSVAVPQYIEDAARANLARADEISKLGYTPYYGPDAAAFTPMQQASFQNTSDMASAFGMNTPASQQDIYGGMGAPTTYANGVSGYSSAPMFEQSMAELEARRPGQYAAINAPFIDPVTGAQPAYPYQGVAGIEAARAAEAAGTPAPVYNRDAYGGRDDYGGRDAYGASAGSTGTGGGMFGGYRGFGDMVDRGGPNAKGGAFSGGGAVSDAANAATGGGMFGGYRGFGDMVDGGGPNAKGGAFSGGGAISGAANAATGGDGPGGDKVICTALHELGRLSDDIYVLDAQFGLRVNREDPMLGDGYRLWATSVANYIKGDSIGSKVALAIVSPVAKAWAAEMAHVMRPDDYKSNIFGKALMAVGHPICRMIGKVFLPKMKTEIV